MPVTSSTRADPWFWIPTLYLAEGLPYVTVMTVAVIMYKGLGVSNTDIALYTGWLYLPWVIKPLWSPVVELFKTRRWWIWAMQFVVGAGLAGVALTIPGPRGFQITLAFLWLVAFSSATHDIAADGFYMLANPERDQAMFSGVRNTFYRIASIAGQGFLVMLAGVIQNSTGLPTLEIEIEAKPDAALVQSIDLRRLPESRVSDGTLRLVAESTRVQIVPQKRAKSEIAAQVEDARKWNSENRFLRTWRGSEEASINVQHNTTTGVAESVCGPLGGFLRRHFGGKSASMPVEVGNIGVISLRLSQPPGREMVVIPAFKAGNKGVAVVEGARLVFDDQNWNKSALAVFQLDPELKGEARAVFEIRSGDIAFAWTVAFIVLAGMFGVFCCWHKCVLPYPASDRPGGAGNARNFINEVFATFRSFFRKPDILPLLLFLLFYRFAEAQLMKMVAPFLLDAREAGGLGLTTGEVGFAYGTVGVIALMGGGLLGGFVVARWGLKFWLWPMVFAMHLPDGVFIWLAWLQPQDLAVISAGLAVEQFGYGFGFAAYMLYMIYAARGSHRTAHYAICTGFMALGMMVPGMWSGWLQDQIGYQNFFWWVLLSTLPGFAVVRLVSVDAEFGRRTIHSES